MYQVINTALLLDINTSLIDTDGSEVIDSIVISNVPAEATLSAGVNNGDGTWTLASSDLTGLTYSTTDDESVTLGVEVITGYRLRDRFNHHQ